MTVSYGDVPLINPLTGRFPDAFAPPSVAQAVIDAAASAADSATSADESEAARDLAIAARTATESLVKIGVGDPRTPASTGGVITDTEPNGCTYISTDGGGIGGYSWRKRAGVWACVEGDTGPLDASSKLPSTWVPAASAGLCVIQRTGQDVTLTLKLSPSGALLGTARSASASLGTTLTGISGMRRSPASWALYGHARLGASNGPVFLRALSAPDEMSIAAAGASGTWVAGDDVTATVNWITRDPWPNTLTL